MNQPPRGVAFRRRTPQGPPPGFYPTPDQACQFFGKRRFPPTGDLAKQPTLLFLCCRGFEGPSEFPRTTRGRPWRKISQLAHQLLARRGRSVSLHRRPTARQGGAYSEHTRVVPCPFTDAHQRHPGFGSAMGFVMKDAGSLFHVGRGPASEKGAFPAWSTTLSAAATVCFPGPGNGVAGGTSREREAVRPLLDHLEPSTHEPPRCSHRSTASDRLGLLGTQADRGRRKIGEHRARCCLLTRPPRRFRNSRQKPFRDDGTSLAQPRSCLKRHVEAEECYPISAPPPGQEGSRAPGLP